MTRYRLELVKIERLDGTVLTAELSSDRTGRGRVILVEAGGMLQRARSVCVRADETLQLASALDAAARKVDRFGRMRG